MARQPELAYAICAEARAELVAATAELDELAVRHDPQAEDQGAFLVGATLHLPAQLREIADLLEAAQSVAKRR